MKKFLIGLGVIIGILAVLGFVFRDIVQFAAMAYSMQPDQAFADTTQPPAPDYDDAAHWAALPGTDDKADVTPGDAEDHQASAAADVFFIHPTTYYESTGWNQALDNATANAITDDGVLRNQASVFNTCCRIYAPRYRQATLYAFFDLEGDGGDAIDFAYQDVVSAFHYYLEHYNDGRPFILAGHSQGGLHLDTLLREEINGTPLQEQMIAAYPVGYSLDGSNGIPVCQSPEQTGCQATWNSLALDAQSFGDASNNICVNPINWSADGTRADFAENKGAVTYGFLEASGEVAVETGVADAQCIDGVLRVAEVRSDHYPSIMFGEGNYHVYDYSLFHMNIRENAMLRTESYLNAR